MTRAAALILIVTATVSGCQSTPEKSSSVEASAQRARTLDAQRSRPIGYINAQAITASDLLPALYEAAGGQTLADLVLERQIAARLKRRELTVDVAARDAEKALILETLSDDPDTAIRLLDELRNSRGLGKARFEVMLWRNAGLRMLVADQVEVTDAAVKQAYLLRYGPRYRVRLIVSDSAEEAAKLRTRAMQGDSFADLASLHSIDPSAAQGGLLSPISPADPQYPQALRNALPRLTPDEPSRVIALPDRFAVLSLVDKIKSDAVELADVKEELAESVRRRNQRLLMEQLARELLANAEVIVLEPALKPAWEQQRKRLTTP